MKIEPIRAFNDNYIWCLREGSEAVVIDPGDAGPVQQFCDAEGLTLRAIWLTHHHPDHVGGVAALVARWPDIPVLGPAASPFTAVTRQLHDGDTVAAFGTTFRVIAVPGHTLDHIAFAAVTHAPPLLFCGDTLFSGGCGRLFEGTPEQMHASLQRLGSLPPTTAVFCAHEYTRANLAFAEAVDPQNPALRQRLAEVERLRAADQPTLPVALAVELETNPFLRCDQPPVVAAARARGDEAATPVAVFASIRRWKDHF